MHAFRFPTIIAFLALIWASAAQAGTIIEEWSTVQPPAVVEAKTLAVNATDTALLILDIEELTCNAQARPRCVESAPKIGELLAKARAAKLPVVYSLTRKGTPATILPPVAPKPGDPIVQSSVDKFYGTELEIILKKLGVQNVIITGTTAEGAVLHTATGAAMRGYNVIVPIDGMSAANLYAEQYTSWHLLNAPGTRGKASLTTLGGISITPR